jgi:signal transduction histidine kinase
MLRQMTSSSAPRVVWVVDDSRLDVERARRVLAGDYQVTTFHDGSAALEHLSAGGDCPDVMVLDWVMPGVTGVDVCRFLRASGSSAQKIGILLLTVHRDTKQIVEGLSAGANDFLAKPYEDEELLARVASLARTRELVDGLEQAQAENRRLLETAPDAFIVSDPAGKLTFVNEQAARVFGSPREQLIGSDVVSLMPGLRIQPIQIKAGESLVPIPDVTIGASRFSPTLRTLADGSTVTSLRDVTERRRVEERRLDFYSIIAHDLRTPLHAMTLRLSSMIEHSKKGQRATLDADLQKLDGRLHSLVEMINDFLDLASLEGASYRIDSTEVDLLQLIQRAYEDFSPLIERNKQHYKPPVLDDPRDALVPGDAKRLMQVLSNLFSNAIKFTGEGGHIAAELSVSERHVELAIVDSGAGIASAQQTRLFQRYARAEHSVGGTGLGLLIVREIVEAHGGVVGVESSLGQGSRFWVRLPRVAGIALS